MGWGCLMSFEEVLSRMHVLSCSLSPPSCLRFSLSRVLLHPSSLSPSLLWVGFLSSHCDKSFFSSDIPGTTTKLVFPTQSQL